jgi:cytochrome c oxidase subunit 3
MSDSHVVAPHAAELRHHFADMEQQRDASTLGMWLFLVTEIMFFGGMFCAYLIYRLNHFADFAAASGTLDLRLGAVNTAVLIGSSVTVVLAVYAAQMGNRRQLVMWLLVTVLLGLTFLGIKAVEYNEKFEHHHVPGPSFSFDAPVPGHPHMKADPKHAELFFSLYFAMTGMHALHMIIGVGLFTSLAYMAWRGRYTKEYHTPIENAGLYWHFVDIIWIYLFPLLYLISRHH